MRFVRLTSWVITGLLLLHGSGAVSSLHMLTHQAHEPGVSSCAPADRSHAHEHEPNPDPEPTPEPAPEPGDKDCSICLGLAGLHLSSVDTETRVVIVPAFAEPMRSQALLHQKRITHALSDARAPPVC